MSKNCGSNKIYRNGYTRKTRSGKLIKVPGNCITATSQTGRKTSVETKRYLQNRDRMHRQMSKKYGVTRCPPGTIERAGFVRKPTKRKSYKRMSRSGSIVRIPATNVKRSEVPPTCVKDTGIKGKGKQLFVLEKNVLGKYGYDKVSTLSSTKRHEALKKALKRIKPLPLFRRLNALYVVNKNTNKNLARIFAEDRDWIKTRPEYQNRTTRK